jgi:2-desacetyl-2-hydroxyethyl bacteriochlorophyllide A dehydrogenase
MKAMLFESGSEFRVVEMPDPTTSDLDVLIQVGACGICASDLHMAEIKAGLTDLPYPFVAGHEVAGTVVKVGTSVTNVHAGEHVAIEPNVPCGTCSFCRSGYANLCQDLQTIGYHRPGGFAEYVAVPAQNVYVSGDLPDAVAACTEPLACTLHGLTRLDPRVADHVLLFGAGIIGLFFLQLIRKRGAGRVTVVDLNPNRLEIARQLGADQLVVADGPKAGKQQLGSTLEELAPLGFDCVIDATGVPSVVEAAFRHVAPGGRLLMLGSCPTEAFISIRPRIIQYRDVTVIGSFGYSFEFEPALRLLQEGHVQTDLIVTHHYPLDASKEAFEQARSGRAAVKVHITPS